MASLNVNVGVSGIGQFKSGMAQAQASVKTMDAALKKAEQEFKQTGNAEDYMAKKTDLLQQKLNAQKQAAANAEQALMQLGKNGVDPASTAYQKMAQTLLNAEAAVLQTENEINGLGTSSQNAAQKTDQLSSSLGGLNKKVSLDQVIGVVDRISGGMENAAKKVVQLGQDLWDVIMDSAKWADDTATMAQMFGFDIDTYQRMQKLVTNGMDTSVESMLAAQSKLRKGVGKETAEVMEYLQDLGLAYEYLDKYGENHTALVTQDDVALFWQAGQALMEMGNAYDKEAAAQALFGRSWRELVPLFDKYKSAEEYNAALQDVTVNSEETVENLAALNDKVSELKGNFDTLKNEVVGALAPALTGAADALNGLLESLMEYLQTPEGKQMLEDLGTAVTGLFEDLSKIDPQDVVSGFVGVFDAIISGLQWVVNNSEKVIGALKAIVIGWGALKLAGGALEIIKLIDGLKGLGIGAGSYAAAGQAAGSAWGASFAAAAIKAVPWLAGLINLLTPSGTGNDDEYYNGQITESGMQNLANSIRRGEFWSGQDGWDYGDWSGVGKWISEHYESDLWDDILNNYAALNALAGFKTGQKTEYELAVALNQLGFALRENTKEQKEADESHPAYVKGAEAGTYYNGENYGIYNLQNERVGTDLRMLLGEPGGVAPNFRGKKADAEVTVRPIAEDGAAEDIEAQIGAVRLPVFLVIQDIQKGRTGFLGSLSGLFDGGHANGLGYVPFDGYAALLHRGERVLTARENQNYTYNNNTYFGNVNLNNGLEIEALTESMERRNRMQRAGYGAW